MTNRYLTDLADVLRDAGLRVVEVDGWKTRGRPHSTGGFDPRGNDWHHTGAKDTNPLSIQDDLEYAEWLAEIGRSDLPAPLSQLSVGRDGTIYVCAAGRGNHAGDAKAFGTLPAGDGNEMYLGWECQNTGTEGWTTEQYDAMVRGGAAVCLHYGWPAENNPGHKETSYTGKWDPGGLDMAEFRDDIDDAMRALRRSTKQTVKRINRLIKGHRKTAQTAAAAGFNGAARQVRARIPGLKKIRARIKHDARTSAATTKR